MLIKEENKMFCELCGDTREESDLNEELLCPPCEEREERGDVKAA